MKKLGGGTVYDLSIHLVLVTKYRRQVFDRERLDRLREICASVCQKWECELEEFSGEADHVHLLVGINPKVQISKFANNLKTVSSRLLWKEYEEELGRTYRQRVLWKIGYCVVSTGGANVETVKRYIQQQQVPGES